MQVRIAICDDDEQTVQNVKDRTEECLLSAGVPYEITPYTKSTNLLADVRDDGFFFDIVLLDIEMPDVDGMTLAGQLHQLLPAVRIILITNHMKYVLDAFALSVFRYVPKQDHEDRLEAALGDAVRLLRLEADRYLVVSKGRKMTRIAHREIRCIERQGRSVVITTANERIPVRRSLQQVLAELGAEEFIFTDRGIIVNLIHVSRLRKDTLVLTDGTELPVSRSHQKSVKEALCRFWGKVL